MKLQLFLGYILFLSLFTQCLPKKIYTAISTKHNEIGKCNKMQWVDRNTNLLANRQKVAIIRGGSIEFSLSIPSLSLIQYKLLLQALLTSFNFACWLVPFCNSKLRGERRFLSLANCFSGGIFLVLALINLIPQAVTDLADNGGDGYHSLYFVLVGFLAMLFVEKIAFGDGFELINHQDGKEKENASVRRSLNSAQVLCLAMGVHSFFESAAVGLAATKSSASLMASSIAIHQPAESLALLIAFLKTDMTMSNIFSWLSIFSSVTFFGHLIGLLVKRLATGTVEALIVAVTAGTFIYVGANEVVEEEFEIKDRKEKLKNFLAYFAGIVCMSLILRISE